MTSKTLDTLDPQSFEQLINSLSIRVLGNGHTGFGPGADGGRDGYFEGSAPYPSETDNWSGIWYIQSKYHKPHLSTDSQKWLLNQIKSELNLFAEDTERTLPDNWIIATNINPSGTPNTGTFDKARKLVASHNAELAKRFHIWGGDKIINLLGLFPQVADQYGHFLTPGNVLKELYDFMRKDSVSMKDLIRYLIIKEFETSLYTKLDQAGSQADSRPGVHELFVDLPIHCHKKEYSGLAINDMLRTASANHRPSFLPTESAWRQWSNHPSRARAWFVLGGPGQGKSTTGQYFSQIQRAAIIDNWEGDPIKPIIREQADAIKKAASARGHWPICPRIPVTIELRNYAKWFSSTSDNLPRGILSYLCHKIQIYIQRPVATSTVREALKYRSWFFAFDGLDEVPSDVKDNIATELIQFVDDTTYEEDCDALILCTSRPQGYAGQLNDLDALSCHLSELSKEKALECATPVVKIGRSHEEAEKGVTILTSAIESVAVASLMTTPLQAHIMAVVVRDGRRPPERRWALFDNFYQVIKNREANRDLPDVRLAKLLREENQLLRTIHNKMGFVLHAQAEVSEGAQTAISREDFKNMATRVVEAMKSVDIPETIKTLEEATETRLVLVNTPDDGQSLRYDIRQLQEFFAAEYFYSHADIELFRKRIATAGADPHWREVMHFLMSAIIELSRQSEIREIVSYICLLDKGAGDESVRHLRRRFCTGALLVSKLLLDGVFEQDKRIRALFESALKPILASNSIGTIYPLSKIELPQSRDWILSICFEHLKNASPFEGVGAAWLLLVMLDDRDIRSNECLILICSQPLSLRKEVMHSLLLYQHKISLSSLYLTFLIRQLRANDWDKVFDHFYAVFDLIGQANDIPSLENAEWLMLKFISEESSGRDLGEPYTRIAGIFLYKTSEGAPFDELPVEAYVNERGFPHPNFFQFASACAKFSANPSEKLFGRLKTFVNNLSSRLQFPSPIQRTVNYFRSRSSLPDNLSQDYADYLSSNDILISYSYQKPFELSLESLKEVSKLSTRIAVNVYFEALLAKQEQGNPECANFIVGLLREEPSFALYQGVLGWGALLQFVSPAHLDEAKRILEATVSDRERVRSVRGGIFPYKLQLPEDLSLLPHLLEEIFFHYPRGRGYIRGYRVVQLDSPQDLLKTISFFFEIDKLNVSHLPTASDIERVCCLILSCLSGDRMKNGIRRAYSLCFDTLDRTENFPLLRIVMGVLALIGGVPKKEDLEFVSRLLFRFQTCFERRREMEHLLSVWRETSSFPVTGSDPKIWSENE